MTPSVTLLMAIHCHQPVGNFGFVFEEAYARAYEPFLHALERHPGVHLALHYSGSLLDWLIAHRPGFLERLRALVRRGQVELLASGYYEPILPLIPEADRQGQIARMRAALRRQCGAEATGLWMTERVWDPALPSTLAQAGIRYTMLDTSQFATARPWLPDALQVQDDLFWDLLGCYATNDTGSTVVVFPSSKRLRYWIPFQPVEWTIEFLRRCGRGGGGPIPSKDPQANLFRAESREAGAPVEGSTSPMPLAVTFADDGEKFGFWPKTYRWVYEEGWLDRFFTALEREQAWLRTGTFRAYLKEAGPNGRVSLPCGSYEEMLEWSGGYFRHFFAKYPEANAMQQKMLRVSRRLAELKANSLRAQGKGRRRFSSTLHPSPARREALLREAEDALYAAQCNCAYWHGVFGGLYLAHLRRAVYANLIAAERSLNQADEGSPAVTVLDADGDGWEEIGLRGRAMSVVIDPREGGAVTEWSLFTPARNLVDTLTRRHEPYHEKLKAARLEAAAPAGRAPLSIHDVLGVKEGNLAAHLVYDDHRRCAFLDYALQSLPSLQELVRSTWGERRLWSVEPFRVHRRPTGGRRDRLRVSLVRHDARGRIRKTIQLSADQPQLECRYELEGVWVPVVGLEFNLSLRDERYVTRAAHHPAASTFEIAEPSAGLTVRLSIDPPAELMHFPIETVSESEEGLERTYQGLCLMCFWPLGLTPPAGSAEGQEPARWASRLVWVAEASR